MNIFLLILKIIGIVLLALLCTVIVLLGLVLFVPFRYRISADYMEDGDKTARISLTWLFHFINFRAWYSDDLYYIFRIIIFPLKKSDNLIKKRKTNKGKAKPKKTEIEEDKSDDCPADYLMDGSAENTADYLTEGSEETYSLTNLEEDNSGSEKSLEDDEVKKAGLFDFFDWISNVIEKIIDFIINLDERVETLKKKVSDFTKNIEDKQDLIEYYIDALTDEKNKATLAMCYNRISRVLKHIIPRKLSGYARFGFEDPALTGQILSIYSVLYPFIHDKIQVVPEFNEEILEGKLYVKGRIRVAVVLWAAVKLYFSKDVRRLIKVYKRE